MYEQVLDGMTIPNAARDQMMQQPLESKWKQICLHKDHIRSNASVRDLDWLVRVVIAKSAW